MTYRLAERAEADLAEIWDYSAQAWSVDQADRYIDALLTRFCWLSENAALWRSRPELLDGLYSYSQQSHVIYFRRGVDATEVIEIVRVLHGRMEPDEHVR